MHYLTGPETIRDASRHRLGFAWSRTTPGWASPSIFTMFLPCTCGGAYLAMRIAKMINHCAVITDTVITALAHQRVTCSPATPVMATTAVMATDGHYHYEMASAALRDGICYSECTCWPASSRRRASCQSASRGRRRRSRPERSGVVEISRDQSRGAERSREEPRAAEISREWPRVAEWTESVCLKGVDDGRVLARDRVVVEPHRAALGLVRHLPRRVRGSVTPSRTAGLAASACERRRSRVERRSRVRGRTLRVWTYDRVTPYARRDDISRGVWCRRVRERDKCPGSTSLAHPAAEINK